MNHDGHQAGGTANTHKPNDLIAAGQDGFLGIVLESLTHPFYVIDARDYTIKMANSAARLGQVTGTTTCHALTHWKNSPCGTEAHPCPLELVKQTRKPVTVEHVHYDKDGNVKNVEVHGFPICDRDGNVALMIEYCIDITDRKKAEAARRASEERYSELADSLEQVIYWADPQTFAASYHNRMVETVWGYSLDEWQNDPLLWGKTLHAEDQERVLATFTAARETGVGGIVEYRIVRKDKQIRWVVDRFNWRRDADGRICSLHGIVADITSRKQAEAALLQSEQRYRSFVQNFQGIVYQGHMNFVPIFFHGAVEKITGYREAEFVAGRPRWDEVIHADDFVVIAQAEEGLRTVPGYVAEREYRILRKDKQVRWVHELIQNVCDDSGKPKFVQGAIYDITERKQMEEDLRRHREHLEELVRARTTELTTTNQQLREEITRRRLLEEELLDIVERERQRIGQELHDSIGQQLTGIAFMMEVLGERLSGVSSVKDAAYMERISSCVVRAAEQTRTLARGLHPVALAEGGLAVALRELASNTQELFGISCTVRHETDIAPDHESTAINLYRIAQEAITNAVRHGKAKSVEIELNRENGAITLRVTNDGLDLPEQEARGKGMGLRIMQHRAEIIGGSLDIQRRAGGGAVVICTVEDSQRTR